VRSCWNGTCRVTLGVGAGTYYIRWHGFGGDASPDRGIRTEINPPIEPEQAPADLQAAGIFNQPPLAAEGAAELSLRWPVDANLTLTTTGVDGGECPGDTILAVLQAGEVVAMNDDTNGLCSQVELPVQAGVEYTVRVTAFRQVALPAYALEVR
jgi:hypothetical protein